MTPEKASSGGANDISSVLADLIGDIGFWSSLDGSVLPEDYVLRAPGPPAVAVTAASGL